MKRSGIEEEGWTGTEGTEPVSWIAFELGWHSRFRIPLHPGYNVVLAQWGTYRSFRAARVGTGHGFRDGTESVKNRGLSLTFPNGLTPSSSVDDTRNNRGNNRGRTTVFEPQAQATVFTMERSQWRTVVCP